MHVVDHVEGQGGKNENVETQCKYREQKKIGTNLSWYPDFWGHTSSHLSFQVTGLIVLLLYNIGMRKRRTRTTAGVGLALLSPHAAGPKAKAKGWKSNRTREQT